MQVQGEVGVRLHDEAFIHGSFEIAPNALDSISMFHLGIMRESGTLVNSIGQVRSGGLLKEQEFANHPVVVEASIKSRRIQMLGKELGADHWSVMCFDIWTIQAKVFKNGLDESLLSQVNGAILLVLNVHAQEIINAIFRSDGQASGLNLSDDIVKLPLVRTNKDAIISVQDIHAVAFVENTLIMFGDFETNRQKLGLEVQVPHSARILSTINVSGNIEDPVLGIVARKLTSFGDFHEHGSGCRSLWIGLNIIHLFGMPSM